MLTKPNQPQRDFITNVYKYNNNIFRAGWGTGKSLAIAHCAFLSIYDWELGVDGAFLGPTFGELERTLLRAWETVVPKGYYHISRGSDPHIKCYGWGGERPALIYLYSCATEKDEKRIEGANLGWGAFDEGQDLTESAVHRLRGRVRLPSVKRLRIFGGTLSESGTWVHHEFAKGTASVWRWAEGTLLDNQENLHPDYGKTLRGMLSPRLARSRIDNIFAPQDGQIYPEFDLLRHVSVDSIPLREDLPFYVGQDFNRAPMATTISQYDPDLDMDFIVGEIVEPNTTPLAARAVAQWFIDRGIDYRDYRKVVVYPDASGQSVNQITDSNNHAVFREEGFFVDALPCNPRVEHRDNAVSCRLLTSDGQVHLTIDPSCVQLIDAFQKLRDKGRSTSPHSHVLDALGYTLHRLHPITDGFLSEEDRAALETSEASRGAVLDSERAWQDSSTPF
jgi:hypothetical protein